MSVGKVSVGKVSVGKVSVGKVSVGKVSVGKVSVGKVSVGKVSVGCDVTSRNFYFVSRICSFSRSNFLLHIRRSIVVVSMLSINYHNFMFVYCFSISVIEHLTTILELIEILKRYVFK